MLETPAPAPGEVKLTNQARAKLRAAVKKIEDWHDEAHDISLEVAAKYKELKAEGFDTKAIKRLIQLRAMDPAKRQELEAAIALYEEATAHLHVAAGKG